MAVKRSSKSWGYDFKLPNLPRQREQGYRTKSEAEAAERNARDALLNGHRQTTFAQAYEQYRAATKLKARTADTYDLAWKLHIEAKLGHLFLEQVDTHALDAFKRTLPTHWGPKTINNVLALISAVLRFAWTRGRLKHVPYVPKESVPQRPTEWYSEAERDRLLQGMLELQPRWYLFFYLTMRLGLRLGEVYAISRRQIRDIPPMLVIDQSVQRGTKERAALVIDTRKNDEAYSLDLSEDVIEAIRWHIAQGYAGPEFLFSENGKFPRYIDSHVRPLLVVQKALGLRMLSHHKIGRHSVASQAVTAGLSIKAVQAQLGHRSEQSTHRYAHLGSKAQRQLIESLAPSAPPHVNLMPTSNKKGT